MTPHNKKRIIHEIAWRLYKARTEYEQISLGSCRYDTERVERDYDLLGITEFSKKYEQFIHGERK